MADYHSVRNKYARDEHGGHTVVVRSGGIGNILKIGLWIVVAVVLFMFADWWLSAGGAQEIASIPAVQAAREAVQPAAQPVAPVAAPVQAPAMAPAAVPVQPAPSLVNESSATSQEWHPMSDGRLSTVINGVTYCTPRPMSGQELYFFGQALRNDPGHQIYRC